MDISTIHLLEDILSLSNTLTFSVKRFQLLSFGKFIFVFILRKRIYDDTIMMNYKTLKNTGKQEITFFKRILISFLHFNLTKKEILGIYINMIISYI